jgi:hypothetical protein
MRGRVDAERVGFVAVDQLNQFFHAPLMIHNVSLAAL